jgi:hypothetical protein
MKQAAREVCLAYSYTVEVVVKWFSETSVYVDRTTRPIPEDRTLQSHYCENLQKITI